VVEFFARTMAQDRERNIRYFNEYGMYCMLARHVYTNRIRFPSDPGEEPVAATK